MPDSAAIPDALPPVAGPPVPAGAPKWVTSDLIAATLRVWQPYYTTRLSVHDALAMLLGTGRLMDVLGGR